ncbi:COMM domain-containing protein 9 [Myotis myotis]|uniref:COMM domain containing 9 n=1 Tax=Myotis myotis TaxID=51298 RepID=A0A7J7VH64_MYOMY|nr:COMM domain-containing protein 9 [Myotis myotis]XP_059565631.1 COMM domain-containing protein 9 isoform X2 [Myotis daubentonii]KAF6324306.1 COMM domain containing 9 [Myotis myotis]
MAALTADNFGALQSLLKASSKDVVRQLCQESFSSSALGSKELLDITCSSLSVTQEEAEQLLQALHRLTRLAAFRDLSSAEAVLALFPANFHQNLKNLLTKIILENISTWRAEAQADLISLPRLVDLDWRVDIKTASDSISRMVVPTCLLQMKIKEDPRLCRDSPSVSAVTMELSKETLDTMLDGLGRIRDQLSAVANK